MKSSYMSMAILMGLFATQDNFGKLPEIDDHESDEDRIKRLKRDAEHKKRILAQQEADRNKAKGLRQFFYGPNSLWALNQKSADKKAKRNNWI